MSEEFDVSVRTWTEEEFWRCKHCQTLCPGMRGAERESLRCTECGAEKTDEPWVAADEPGRATPLTGELDARARRGPNWDCTFCGAQSRAHHARCESCGAEREDSALRDNAERIRRGLPPFVVDPKPFKDPLAEVLKPAPKRAAADPPRWTTAPADWAGNHPVEAPLPKGAPQAGDYRKPAYAPVPPEAPEPLVVPTTPTWPRTLGLGVLGVGAVAFVAWLLVWSLAPNETTARVARMTWERRVALEEVHTYAGSGWRADAPAGVFAWDRCEERQNGTERCHPHDCDCHPVYYDCRCTGGDRYRCNCSRSCSTSCSSNRNGSRTCSERCSTSCDTCRTPRRCDRCSRTACDTCYDRCPTYATWCSYRYHQWDVIDRAATAGRGPAGVVWPGLEAHGGEQRLAREEVYTVNFQDERSHRAWERRYDYAGYGRFAEGQRWRVEWTRAGGFRLLGRAP